MALVSFPFSHVHGGDSRSTSGPTLKLKGDPKQWLATNDPLFTEETAPNSDTESGGPTSIRVNEDLYLDLDEEVRKGWWDGRLLAEFQGVLETLPEDDPRLARLLT